MFLFTAAETVRQDEDITVEIVKTDCSVSL
jgi:hypothetical protein